jgi:REP element-mobilizing transposase RayT
MPILEKHLAKFSEHGIYHVFNRTNNSELLFMDDENRLFFLKKFEIYLSKFLDTYAWCLLPNHFHLLVQVKSAGEIINTLQRADPKEMTLVENRFLHNEKVNIAELLEQAFKRFFQCYALSFNKRYKRRGNLFYKPFKRIEINKESYFTQAIIYIHTNPLKHKVTDDFTSYKWSSWQSMLSDAPTRIMRKEVLDWFGGKDQFIQAHNNMANYYYGAENYSIEN